ncbi:hypothetical protein SADUNF_Sadunf01G0015200 [Salix dunnii]|uniref:Uncharacterized protein n=1 Tax=Salix dunnii TaxID=1413687 RepID=A0A835TLK2_9ROSI|nr:hypothetical protein SADUNF_Sadunf01G0015200 [Salix dunnii]
MVENQFNSKYDINLDFPTRPLFFAPQNDSHTVPHSTTPPTSSTIQTITPNLTAPNPPPRRSSRPITTPQYLQDFHLNMTLPSRPDLTSSMNSTATLIFRLQNTTSLFSAWLRDWIQGKDSISLKAERHKGCFVYGGLASFEIREGMSKYHPVSFGAKGAKNFSSACFYFNFDKLVAARACTNNVAEKKIQDMKEINIVSEKVTFIDDKPTLRRNSAETKDSICRRSSGDFERDARKKPRYRLSTCFCIESLVLPPVVGPIENTQCTSLIRFGSSKALINKENNISRLCS